MLAVTTVELTIRMVVGLAVIAGLLWATTRLARGRLGMDAETVNVEVKARRALTKNSSLVLVKAGSRHLLIGANDHAVSLLAEGDDLLDGDSDIDDGAEVDLRSRPTTRRRLQRTGSTSRPKLLDGLRAKTVRRG
ncbi:MAG: flagellar biosynthetic protein FliO [Actinomycetota bacterium]